MRTASVVASRRYTIPSVVSSPLMIRGSAVVQDTSRSSTPARHLTDDDCTVCGIPPLTRACRELGRSHMVWTSFEVSTQRSRNGQTRKTHRQIERQRPRHDSDARQPALVPVLVLVLVRGARVGVSHHMCACMVRFGLHSHAPWLILCRVLSLIASFMFSQTHSCSHISCQCVSLSNRLCHSFILILSSTLSCSFTVRSRAGYVLTRSATHFL